MKILCCCRNGQVRSVAARYLLHKMGHKDVICCGLAMTGPDTLRFLMEWAELIMVVGSRATFGLMPIGFGEKVHFVNVGPDIWHRFDHPELLEILALTMRI